jgi:hypothetical protein
MNKALYFVSGLVLGAAGGTAVTYYVVNAKRDEELEEYGEHCEERIEKYRKKYSGEESADNEEKDDSAERHCQDPEEEKIINNEGVKKYHVRPTSESKYGENRVFTTNQSDKERKTVKKEIDKSVEEKDSKLIEDIDEDMYLNDFEPYTRHTIDVLLGDDADIVGFWGYQTDNEMFVEDKYGKDLKGLVGISKSDYDYLLGQVDDEDGVGHIYIRNNEIMVDFEVVIRDMREEDK